MKKGKNVMTQHVGDSIPGAVDADPGPSSIDRAVYRADGHAAGGATWTPWFKGCMEETQILMRQDFSDGKPDHHAALGVGIGRD